MSAPKLPRRFAMGGKITSRPGRDDAAQAAIVPGMSFDDALDALAHTTTVIARAREIHRPVEHDREGGPYCNGCTHAPLALVTGFRYAVRWPCPTARVLDPSAD